MAFDFGPIKIDPNSAIAGGAVVGGLLLIIGGFLGASILADRRAKEHLEKEIQHIMEDQPNRR